MIRFYTAFLLQFFVLLTIAAQTGGGVTIIATATPSCAIKCNGSIFFTVTNITTPSCTYSIQVSGPSSFTASGNGNAVQTLNNLCAGKYKIMVKSCQGDTTGTWVTVPMIVDNSDSTVIYSDNIAPCNFESQDRCEKVCPNSVVTYYTSELNINVTQGFWRVTGAVRTVSNPVNNSVTVYWGNAGTGSVTLLFDGNTGSCTGEITKCVTIVETPVAKIVSIPAPSGDTLTVCTGQTAYFQSQSQFADQTTWQFSDNLANTSEANPTHTFQTPGIFTATLIARSNCLCADTTVQIVKVLGGKSPVLDCIGTVCPGEAVTYTASGGCAPFQWVVSPNASILAGGTAQTDSITVQWNNGPVGTITLSGKACSGQECPQPAVIQIPVISNNAEIKGLEFICPEAEETYSIEPFGGTGFTWKLSGGGYIRSGQGTPQVEIKWEKFTNSNTTHWLSVEYDNCYLGCKGSDSIAVRILSPFTLSGPVELCEKTPFSNFSARLTANSQALTCNWQLFAPDGTVVWSASSPTENVNNIPFNNGPGLYRLFATAANPGESCETKHDWGIQAAPQPPKPMTIDGQRLVCPGQPYSYEVQPESPLYNIAWSIQNSGNATDKGNPINITWAASGIRSISAAQVSTDGLGCTSDTIKANIASLTAPIITGTSIVCENKTGTYSIAPQKNIDIFWKIIPATAGAIANGQGTEKAEIFWSQPGGHAVEVTVCGLKSIFPVTVPTLPTPLVQHIKGLCPGQTAPVNTATAFSNYTWSLPNGNVVSNLAQPMLSAGTYALTVRDGSGCTAATEFTIEEYPLPNLNITTTDPTGFCNNSRNVTITALTEEDGDFKYQWFQDGNPVGGNTVRYTTNQYGNYTAQVTNQYGCSSTDGTVRVFEYCSGGICHNPSHAPRCNPGDVSFDILPTASCDSFNFQLNAGPLYAPGNLEWVFGESGSDKLGISTDENASFRFPNAGKYIVVLYAVLTNGAKCTVLDSLQVEAAAQLSPIPDCAGKAIPFTDESTFLPGSGITSWQWDFGEPASGSNNTAAVRNTTHAFAAAATYAVSLTITANSGCTSTTQRQIAIPGGTPAIFTPPAARCAGNALEFEGLAAPNLTKISWLFGEPATGAANDAQGIKVYHHYTTPGTYTASVTTTNAEGCTAVYAQSITVAPNPLGGNITPGAPPTLCEGGSQTFTAPVGGVKWLWSDKITTSNTFAATKEGVFRVTVTDNNGCTYAPPAVKLNINPAPDALIKALLTDESGQITGTTTQALSLCYGEEVRLRAISATAVSYQWSGGGIGDDISFIKNRNNLLPVGTHTYTVTVRDGNNCTAVSMPFTVVVNPVPAPFTVSSGNFCAGTPTTIQYTGPPTAPSDQLTWNNGKTGANLTTEEPGRYFLRVVNTFGCAAKSNDWLLQPGPAIDLIPAGCHRRCRPDTFCLPNIPNITNWQWFYNGIAVPGATTRDFIARQNGTYWAQLSDVNGCKAQTGPLTLELFDGFGDVLGKVWSDVNKNGVIDAADTVVSGIEVRLLNNGVLTGTLQTGTSGQSAFVSVKAADYTLQLGNLPVGWKPVIGTAPISIVGCNDRKNGALLIEKGCLSAATTLNLTVCPGDSVAYQNTWLKAGATKNFMLLTPQGCDSSVAVKVTARVVSTGSLLAKVCAGSTFEYQNVILLPGETSKFTLQNFAGCDSVVTVTVQGIPTKTNTLNLSVCPGKITEYLGITLRPGDVEILGLTGWQGCDSVVTVSVTALPVPSTTFTAKICLGETFTYENTVLSPGDTQRFTLQTASGCDSLVTVRVVPVPRSTAALPVTVCPGASFLYYGMELRAGDVQDFNLTSWQGCDSVVTVAVSAMTTSRGNFKTTICSNDTLYFHGKTYTPGDSTSVVLTGYNGCDSVVTLQVLAFPAASFDLATGISCPNQPTGNLSVSGATGSLPPYRFSIDGKSFQTSTQFPNLAAGRYTVWVEDGNGCRFRRDTALTTREKLLALAPPATLACDSSAVRLTVWTGGDTTGLRFKWWDGSTAPVNNATDAGLWRVEVRNICEILNREALVEWADFGSVTGLTYIPNVFRPADASEVQNALFKPFFPPTVQLQSYQFQVFDRWGSLLFRSSDPEAGWDGMFNSRRVGSEVMVWYLEARADFCGRSIKIKRKGDVTVVR